MRLSRGEKRRIEREAAEEFFRRKRRQPTQTRPLVEEPPPIVLPATESGLPPTGTTLDIEQSREILRRLASGELKVPK